ncbi:MAG: hypothetical protein GY882_11685 [Actinomycetia bacterium]|nr:hypothetical protein [Actinomycetes bacterium]MCP4845760.1 hypothetical protein [Actinomycetes bacterium]
MSSHDQRTDDLIDFGDAGVPDVFMGGLTVDTGEELPAPMVALMEDHRAAMSSYRSHEIDGNAAVDRLADLILVDDEGWEWTIGAGSSAWYRRRNGGGWAISSPRSATFGTTSPEAADETTVDTTPPPHAEAPGVPAAEGIVPLRRRGVRRDGSGYGSGE